MLKVKNILELDLEQYGNYDVKVSCMSESYVKENINKEDNITNVGDNFFIATVENGEMILEIDWGKAHSTKLRDIPKYINNENVKEDVKITLWDSDDFTSLNLTKIYINQKNNLIILV